MNKSNIIARKLDTFIKWCFRFMLGATILCVPILIVTAIILKIDPNYTNEIMNTFTFGNLEFYVKEDMIPSTNFAIAYILTMGEILLMCAITICICFKILRNIFKPIIAGEPFHTTIFLNLKKLGWISIIFGIISGSFSIVESLVLYYGYDLGTILINENITKVMPQFTFELDFILVSAVIFLLSYIFKYGAQLQQQVDETL